MAKAGLAHDQTVEEILASIRRVISGDQARRGVAPVTAAEAPTVTNGVANGEAAHVVSTVEAQTASAADGPAEPRTNIVTAFTGKPSAPKPLPQDAVFEGTFEIDETALTESDETGIHNGIELAIEQALGSVDPNDIRAETAEPFGMNDATDDADEEAVPTASVIAMPPPKSEPRPVVEPEFAEPAAVVAESYAPAANGHDNAAAYAAQQEPAAASAEQPVYATGLLSPQANAAVSASFDSLAREIAAKGIRDLDQTVESMLRPMLRDWLEANLPGMVERMVREEIERVSRGRR